jgi:hypothetical protein
MGWHWQWSGQWSELVLVLVAGGVEDRAGTDGSGQRESIAALAGTARGSTVGGCRPAPPYHRSCRSFTSPDEEEVEDETEEERNGAVALEGEG